MARDVASFIGKQLVTLSAHYHHELINMHASIHSNFPSEKVFKFRFLNAAWSIVAEKLGQAVNSHCGGMLSLHNNLNFLERVDANTKAAF